MTRKAKSKTAVVIAWRQGEDDLQATIDSAVASVGGSAEVYPVEDKERQGPGQTRHRGIEAADGCDVIIIADSHMRFRGDALRSLAAAARKHGGLFCPLTYHNERCVMDGAPYAGARIVYRAKDGRQKVSLAGKWSRDPKPGPRGCVMGGCYAFRREWYYSVGKPLAALPGWGGDEEILSIAAWLSGFTPQVTDAVVAHRYRSRPPWNVMSEEYARVHASRIALIHAVVSDANARRELEDWQRSWVPEGIPPCTSPEAEALRNTLLNLPRKWREWRAQVCEPDEIDGAQERVPRVAVDRPVVRAIPTANPVVSHTGIRCPHCRRYAEPEKIEVTNTYPNGNKRRICGFCKNPFITRFLATA